MTTAVKASLRRTWLRLRYRAHAACRPIPHPGRRGALLHGSQNITTGNEETRPPHGYDVRMQCVWAVELFTPSDIPNLQTALRRLGMEDRFRPYRDPLSQLQRGRESSGGGSWSNLGYLKRKGDTRLYFQASIAPLPEAVEFASLSLFQISPSLTAIAICFHLKKEAQALPLRILQEDQGQRFVSFGRAYSVLGPEALKEDALTANRQQLRRQLHRWLQNQLPGLFSRAPVERLPVCEFLISSSASGVRKVDDLLGLDRILDWESTEWPGVRFCWPRWRQRDESYHACLAARRDELTAIDVTSYGGGEDVYPHVFGQTLEDFLVRWAILSALGSMRARLSALRDQGFGFSHRNAARAIRALQAMTIETTDIDSVCSDLAERSTSMRGHHDTADFIQKDRQGGPRDHHLLKSIEDAIRAEARQVRQLDARIKTLAVQQGNLLAAGQNLQLQRWVGWLTVVAVVLAAVAAIEPAQKLALMLGWRSPAATQQTQEKKQTSNAGGRPSKSAGSDSSERQTPPQSPAGASGK